jgi:hypothetical protein
MDGGCYRSSRANHFAGRITDREAGGVKSKSLARSGAPLSENLYRTVLQTVKCLTGLGEVTVKAKGTFKSKSVQEKEGLKGDVLGTRMLRVHS